MDPATQVGSAICEAFGIDPRTVSEVTLHAAAGEIPWLTVTRIVLDAGDELQTRLERFEVLPK